jgi:hypothetical protein
MMPDLFVRSRGRKGAADGATRTNPSRTHQSPLGTLLTWTTILVNTNIVARRAMSATPQGTTSKTALRPGDA